MAEIPGTLGECADRLYEIKQEIRPLSKAIEDLETERKAIEAHIIAELPKSNAEGVTGHAAHVRVVTEDMPTPKNWDEIRKFIVDNAAWELIQRRLSNAAIKDRWAAGEVVPGVEPYTVVKVALTKKG